LILEELFKVIRFIRYDYTVLDSTKFTDWHKALHEAFICVRVRLGEALIPVQIGLTSSKAEFIKEIPPGSGFAFADGAFDAKHVLNISASKGLSPLLSQER
jgi:hypothetical protein